MCLIIMMVICIKQHLNNIWSSIHEKVKQHWGVVEKSVTLSKTCIRFAKLINSLLDNHAVLFRRIKSNWRFLLNLMKLSLAERFLKRDLRSAFQWCRLNSCLYCHKLSFTNNCAPIELCSTNHCNGELRLPRFKAPPVLIHRWIRTPPVLILQWNKIPSVN